MGDAFRRLFRVGITTLVAGAAVKYGNNAYYLMLSPALSAAGKYLRAKDPVKWSWLPF